MFDSQTKKLIEINLKTTQKLQANVSKRNKEWGDYESKQTSSENAEECTLPFFTTPACILISCILITLISNFFRLHTKNVTYWVTLVWSSYSERLLFVNDPLTAFISVNIVSPKTTVKNRKTRYHFSMLTRLMRMNSSTFLVFFLHLTCMEAVVEFKLSVYSYLLYRKVIITNIHLRRKCLENYSYI